MIQAENLTKRFCTGDEQVTILSQASLRVDPAEIVALLGPSGSGKTTLLKLIAGVLAPDAGVIRFDSTDISTWTRKQADHYRLRELGFVLQRPRLVAGMSAIENAALRLMSCGRDRADAQRAVAPLLERLDLAGSLDVPARALSEGQRQRVAVAAALSTQPRLVIADEPTGSLDARNSDRVLTLFTDVCKEHGAAVLVATHDLHVCDVADRCIELRGGRIAAPEEVGGA